MSVQVRLLGPVEITEVGGPVPLGGPKERAVLAVLALNAGQVVSEDSLMQALWGDSPPRTATRTLQAYISRLRKVLATGDGVVRIESIGGGFRLDAPGDALDCVRVGRLAADARAAASREDYERAAELYADALAHWTGRPLGEFADEEWARPEAARLAELRLTLLEERVEADLRCGRHAVLTGELEITCKDNPFRERLWAQRILALYRSGRQADALATYRELRHRLADELGVDPSPDVQALERSILKQDETLEPPTPARTVPAASGQPPFPSGLVPVGISDFVGRSAELRSLHEYWQRTAAFDIAQASALPT